MVDGLQISTTTDYLILKIPKKILEEKKVRKKRLTESEALRMFKRGQKEYKEGKLKKVNNLDELL